MEDVMMQSNDNLPWVEQVAQATRRARAGDAAAAAELERLLQAPRSDEGRGLGQAEAIQNNWFSYICAGHADQVGSLQQAFQDHRGRLLAEAKNQCERLLGECVAANWLRLQAAEMALDAYTTTGASELQMARFAVQRFEAIQRRYLASLKMLSDVQRLAKRGNKSGGDELRSKARKGKAGGGPRSGLAATPPATAPDPSAPAP